MSDHLTLLENEIEELYNKRRDAIATAGYVLSWDDYNYRSGYLQAIREIGAMAKNIRNPETTKETGEIPDILMENPNG